MATSEENIVTRRTSKRVCEQSSLKAWAAQQMERQMASAFNNKENQRSTSTPKKKSSTKEKATNTRSDDMAVDFEDEFVSNPTEDVNDEDSDDAFIPAKANKKKPKTSTKNLVKKSTILLKKPAPKDNPYEVKALKALTNKYSSDMAAHMFLNGIHYVNSAHPLESVPSKIQIPGMAYGLALSDDGDILAVAGTFGDVTLWDLSTQTMLSRLYDKEQMAECINESYVVRFSPDSRTVFMAGGCRDRRAWCPVDEDNIIRQAAIKVFDTVSGDLVCTLDGGHTEEILHFVLTTFKGVNHIISAGQDGTIIVWEMDDDWRSSQKKYIMTDAVTTMAFHIAIVPNCANRFFLAACDGTVRLYDLESKKLLKSFGKLFELYCDCVMAVEVPDLKLATNESVFVVRGVDSMLANDMEEGESIDVASNQEASKCLSLKLVLPRTAGKEPTLTQLNRFTSAGYHTPIYLCRLGSNGRYLLAPSVTGSIFVWSIATGEKVAILPAGSSPARDFIFHHRQPLLICSSDDGFVRLWKYAQGDKN
eukprot:CFRG8429T1